MPIRLLVSISAFVLIACGPPRIRIEWDRPPAFNLPPEQPVHVMVEADGSAPTANTVVDAISSFGQGQVLNKWVAVPMVKGELELTLRQGGHTVVSEEGAAVILKVKPTRWSYQYNHRNGGDGRLEAALVIVDAKNPNAQALYSDEYWATSGTQRNEPESMARASRQLAGAVLRTFRPQRVSANVILDDDDPAAEVGISLCKDGQFDAAYAAFSDASTKNPESAPLLYDLAVLAEARGDYDLAESLLTRATGLQQKKFYYSALDRVRRARQDAEGFKAPPAPEQQKP